jgi:hypothetical protein
MKTERNCWDYFTYYERSDVKIALPAGYFFQWRTKGSASVWMHIAYTGPKLLNIDDEGYPLQPMESKKILFHFRCC